MDRTTTRLLTTAEVADRLTVTPWQATQMLRRGDIPAIRFGRKTIRVREADLEEFVAGKVSRP